ncbi:MAG: class I SAM-dependent methyltransferase [Pirellulaceae bacterium]|nr:class I SAM-dependent methyltransferase [Pirellulaceae bacterium]
MALLADLRVLYHLAVKPVRGRDHAERMESFYSGQADAYDDFRRRLLKGREEMYSSLELPDAGVWVDMGGGTGSNVEYRADDLERLKSVYVVDLSKSLLEVADKRFKERGWSNARACTADATTFQPEEPVDVVTFSYSLTMIPDWFTAIENALRMLRPGGLIGVVDFYVSRKYPQATAERHAWWTRHFWPAWFGNDNVFPSADHFPYLHGHFEPVSVGEHRAKIPYLPFVRAPYYTFVGRKSESV